MVTFLYKKWGSILGGDNGQALGNHCGTTHLTFEKPDCGESREHTIQTVTTPSMCASRVLVRKSETEKNRDDVSVAS